MCLCEISLSRNMNVTHTVHMPAIGRKDCLVYFAYLWFRRRFMEPTYTHSQTMSDTKVSTRLVSRIVVFLSSSFTNMRYFVRISFASAVGAGMSKSICKHKHQQTI